MTKPKLVQGINMFTSRLTFSKNIVLQLYNKVVIVTKYSFVVCFYSTFFFCNLKYKKDTLPLPMGPRLWVFGVRGKGSKQLVSFVVGEFSLWFVFEYVWELGRLGNVVRDLISGGSKGKTKGIRIN